ncbi:hypothetical protein AOZ06_04055 [Kibdelosporangium phytohabitans]|uniref:Uncharacterized protein n=1 Tax=Kibdelosporangium phytohabitans TaxID=860235 RepID=A0A0N9HW52_9PSEU|nr:hypothetical protein AOZ06_04055 [Kibdelosporangium phytohabitans]
MEVDPKASVPVVVREFFESAKNPVSSIIDKNVQVVVAFADGGEHCRHTVTATDGGAYQLC